MDSPETTFPRRSLSPADKNKPSPSGEGLFLIDSRLNLRYYGEMTVRVALLGLWFVFALSLAVLGIFLFFVDPAYLAFSGFLLFYLTLFAWLWSMFVLAGYFALGRARRRFPAGWSRRSALLALLAAASIFFQHIDILSVYTLFVLVLVTGGMEYYSMRKK